MTNKQRKYDEIIKDTKEWKLEIKESIGRGFGVFAAEFIPSNVLLTRYKGRYISNEVQEARMKLARMKKQLEQSIDERENDENGPSSKKQCRREKNQQLDEQATFEQHVIRYDVESTEPGFLWTPVDEDGNILQEYFTYAFFINEASRANDILNVRLCAGITDKSEPVFITTRNIERGEEILTYYGDNYDRTYSFELPNICRQPPLQTDGTPPIKLYCKRCTNTKPLWPPITFADKTVRCNLCDKVPQQSLPPLWWKFDSHCFLK